jgi:hypothetical protein
MLYFCLLNSSVIGRNGEYLTLGIEINYQENFFA